MQTIKELVRTIILSLVLIAGVSMVSAWTGPTQAPPGGNVSAPINVGLALQSKTGPVAFKGAFETQNTTLLATLGGEVRFGSGSKTVINDNELKRVDGSPLYFQHSGGSTLFDGGGNVEINPLGIGEGKLKVGTNGSGTYIKANEIGGIGGQDIYLNPAGGQVYVQLGGLAGPGSQYIPLGDGARQCVKFQTIAGRRATCDHYCDASVPGGGMLCVNVQNISVFDSFANCAQPIDNNQFNCICCP